LRFSATANTIANRNKYTALSEILATPSVSCFLIRKIQTIQKIENKSPTSLLASNPAAKYFIHGLSPSLEETMNIEWYQDFDTITGTDCNPGYLSYLWSTQRACS
jgi:hypothetical protein